MSGDCAFPAAPNARRHGLVVRADSGILYAAVRCCHSEEHESHPEIMTVWSTRLVATTRLHDSETATTLTVDPLTWISMTVPRMPLAGVINVASDKRHPHSYNDWYRIRGALSDGRVWFSTGAAFIVQEIDNATDNVAHSSSRWRYSARDENLFQLLGFTPQPDRPFCVILA
jgi:hypothetical protein